MMHMIFGRAQDTNKIQSFRLPYRYNREGTALGGLINPFEPWPGFSTITYIIKDNMQARDLQLIIESENCWK